MPRQGAIPLNVPRLIPFLGPVRKTLLPATMKTPWRFRTRRNLWAYSGLAVVIETSADREIIATVPCSGSARRSHAGSTRTTTAC
jgi:hypothetical protein